MKTFLTVILCAPGISIAAVVANPGFEDPITMDGPPFIGFWESFGSGPSTSVTNSTTTFRSGTQSARVEIVSTINSFAGFFQDIPSLTPGTQVTFAGWHLAGSNPLDVAMEYRIEWRNSVSDSEISRTPNVTIAPTSTWSMFSVDSTVPAGADLARIVYAMQTFGGDGPTHNGIVFVDDITFVPEPSALLLSSTAGIMLLSRRSRHGK